MEWVPETLSSWLSTFDEPPGWDDLAEAVALPLASALALPALRHRLVLSYRADVDNVSSADVVSSILRRARS